MELQCAYLNANGIYVYIYIYIYTYIHIYTYNPKTYHNMFISLSNISIGHVKETLQHTSASKSGQFLMKLRRCTNLSPPSLVVYIIISEIARADLTCFRMFGFTMAVRFMDSLLFIYL